MTLLGLSLLWLLEGFALVEGRVGCAARRRSVELPWETAENAQICPVVGPADEKPTSVPEKSQDPVSKWTLGPVCNGGKGDTFCAYTNKVFNNGEGISIVTSSKRMAKIENLKPFSEKEDEVQRQGRASVSTLSSQYEEAFIPEKGAGLVANKVIPALTPIMTRSPAIMVDGQALDDLTIGQMAELMTQAISQLPAHHRDLYLNLSSDYNKNSEAPLVYRIFATNAFRTGIGDGGQDLHSVFTESKLPWPNQESNLARRTAREAFLSRSLLER